VRQRLGLVGAAGGGVEEGVERPLWLVQRAIYDGGCDGRASSGWRPAAQPAGKPGFATWSLS